MPFVLPMIEHATSHPSPRRSRPNRINGATPSFRCPGIRWLLGVGSLSFGAWHKMVEGACGDRRIPYERLRQAVWKPCLAMQARPPGRIIQEDGRKSDSHKVTLLAAVASVVGLRTDKIDAMQEENDSASSLTTTRLAAAPSFVTGSQINASGSKPEHFVVSQGLQRSNCVSLQARRAHSSRELTRQSVIEFLTDLQGEHHA